MPATSVDVERAFSEGRREIGFMQHNMSAQTFRAEMALVRVPDLWFPDATLVFQADNTEYRLYAGLLAARSSVFADMLAFPQPAGKDSEGERVDGCPRILLHDKAEDATAFFRAIFDSSYFMPPTPAAAAPPLTTLRAILLLSRKYDVPYLTSRALAHLSAVYPMTLAEWDARGYASHILKLHSRIGPPPGTYPILTVLELARDVGANWILPAAMYLGVCAGVEGILGGALERDPADASAALEDCDSEESTPVPAHTLALTPTHQTLLLAAPELHSRCTSTLAFLLSARPSSCLSPEKCTAELAALRHWVDSSWAQCRFPLEIWEPHDWESVAAAEGGDVCGVCVREGRRLHQRAREKLWEGLPGIFGMQNGWDELNRMRDEALKAV
ncbi:hypothetical protein MKEN_00552100 [Mycena kentingensis (nom. inval.)]|nr:hypothetical protein MKEN_00552100 [Mycena kentingensis (nom. inval.)]